MSFEKFKIGQRLEAIDRLYPTLVCVAHIKDIKDGKLLISFDGWSSQYDYWCAADSPEIAPIQTTKGSGKELQPPKNYTKTFDWASYLNEIKAEAAPADAFSNHGIGEFLWSNKLSEKLKQEVAQSGVNAEELRVEGKDIFLSYGREPHITPWVRGIREDLEANGWTVWMDEVGIGSGTNWFLKIGSAVIESHAMVCVMTEKYVHSEWCTSELFMAKQENKVIIPCFYENIPQMKPDVEYALGEEDSWIKFQDAHSGDNYEKAFQQIGKVLVKREIKPNPTMIKKDHKLINYAYNLKKQVDPPVEVLQRLESLLARMERYEQRHAHSMCANCSIM